MHRLLDFKTDVVALFSPDYSKGGRSESDIMAAFRKSLFKKVRQSMTGFTEIIEWPPLTSGIKNYRLLCYFGYC